MERRLRPQERICLCLYFGPRRFLTIGVVFVYSNNIMYAGKAPTVVLSPGDMLGLLRLLQ